MSYEEDKTNYSDYDEESFDNESIEEVSDYDYSISEESNNDPSVEVLLDENATIKSLTGSVDKLSYEEEEEDDDNDKASYDNDFSSSNSVEEDDNAVSEFTENEVHETVNNGQAKLSAQRNDHEIDESDSDVDNNSDIEIAENIKSLNIQSEKPSSAPVTTHDSKYKHNDSAEQRMSDQSEIEFNVTSQTPTSFNSDNHAFHMDIIQNRTRSNGSIPAQRSRNANRKSLSFSNERMREIERHNQILLRKILTQKPRKETAISPKRRTSSSAINRKKQQRQIDLDNQVLKKKIEAISLRRRHTFYQ